MHSVDLFSHKFKTDYDPTNQIATDPTALIGDIVDPLSGVIQALAKSTIFAVTQLLTDPGQLLELALTFPTEGLQALADLGSFLPIGLGSNFDGSGNPIGINLLEAAASFIEGILNPAGIGGLVTFIGSLIPGLDASKITSGNFPMSMILGLEDAIAGAAGVATEILDTIVNALLGTPGHTGNPASLLFTSLSGLVQQVGTAAEAVDSLSYSVQDTLGSFVQIVQQAAVRPALGFISDALDALNFWVLGWFGRTEVAHTGQNAAVATLRGEVNARFAATTTGSEGWVDDFEAPGYSLTTNYLTAPGQGASVLTARTNNAGVTNMVLAPGANYRSTQYYKNQMLTDNMDIEMAISNVSQKGRASLFIGGPSSGLAGGLLAGTLIVRIDNGIDSATKQRLQIYTVNATGAVAAHGSLYSVDFGTWHDGDLIRLRRDTSQTHRVFINDVEACSYNDNINNLVNFGAGMRYAGWRQNLDGSSSNVGVDLDLIHIYDWAT